ncbi:MAG: hypothetical protein ACOYXB_04090 [Bacteroidota bacterium]
MYLKRVFTLFALPLFLASSLHAQELLKAPKQYSVEAGYRYMLKNDLVPGGATSGYTLLLDYAWQLSGYTTAKKPIYLSVPLAYTWFPGTNGATGMRMLSYGWTVRHMLTRDRAVNPFLGYALLLNQVSVDGVEGQLFGHQTRFEAGVNFGGSARLKPYIKVEYSMSRHPQLNDPESYWLHAVELKAGVRIR